MKLIATSTVILGVEVRARDPKNPADKGEYKRATYTPDTPFEVDEETALQLIRDGHAVRETVTAPSAPETKKPKGKKELIAAIGDAAGKLDPKNEDHFTTSGKPSTHALEKQLGYDISAAERDEAWAAVKPK